MNTVSIDAGNGFTNAATMKGKSVKTIGFPSIRATAQGESLNIDGIAELDYEFYDWSGMRYVVGDDASLISLDIVESHKGYNRYGNEMHCFFIAVALTKLGLKGGDIDLTIFVPPGLYIAQRDGILERFAERDNQLVIKVKGDRKPRVFDLVNINILPEGLGAMSCFVLDKSGKPTGNTDLAGRVLLLDIGMYTSDAILLQDGAFNQEALSSATTEGFGIFHRILQPLANEVKKKHRDFSLITPTDIDRVVRNGLKTGDFTLSSGASAVDIAPRYTTLKTAFANTISDVITDSGFSDLRGIDKVIVIGGGAGLLVEKLSSQYEAGKIATFGDFQQVKGISPLEANTIGGLRYALMKAKQTA